MLFIISFLMFNVSYLFRVLFLIFLLFVFFLIWRRRIIYLKYLIVLVYVRGVVIFILYISCICWNQKNYITFFFIFLGLWIIRIFDSGLITKLNDVGEYIWIFMFFSLIFRNLLYIYSLLLFKVAGSLRF